MTTDVATTTEAPFDPKELAAQISDLPKIYFDSSDRVTKALHAANILIERIKDDGVDEELSKEIVVHMKRVKNTIVTIKNNRTGPTQMLDLLKKQFTKLESDMKESNDKLKTYLDSYAAEQARIQREKEAEAARKAAHEKELGEIEAEAEKSLKMSFITHLNNQKRYLNTVLEDMQLPIVDSVRTVLKGFSEDLSPKDLKWAKFELQLVTDEELLAIKKKVGASVAPELKTQYKQEIADLKKELYDKVPSKVAELEEAKRLADEVAAAAKKAKEEEEKRQADIAKANAKEKARLEEEDRKAKAIEAERQAKAKAEQDKLDAERKKRQEEENQRLEAEAEAARKSAEEKAKAQYESSAMNAMFDVEVASSGSSVPKGKITYEITVTHQKGYSEMFALWFAREGGTMELDKLENISLKRIREYFERRAGEGEKIESKYIKYKEGFSTNVRR